MNYFLWKSLPETPSYEKHLNFETKFILTSINEGSREPANSSRINLQKHGSFRLH